MKLLNYIPKVFLLLLVFNSNVFANKVDSPFESISLTTAKEIAQAEGKYVFIDFYADWCVPCKWMDETTYADKNIVKTLKDRFVSVKVNIDDFDGYSLKEEYNVRDLPTVIVLDQRGRVIKRFEESMAPAKLKDILDGIAGEISNTDTTHETNISPKDIKSNDNRNFNNGSDLKNDNRTLDNTVIVKTNKSFRVQVGVYTDYANTINLVDNINAKLDEPVVVLNGYLNNKTVYKVYVGDYDSIEKARSLKDNIKSKLGLNGFIKVFE